jgi:hypothetical protein
MSREIQIELLVGRKVHDVDGCLAGRIEELIAVLDGPDMVITEYHLGPAGLGERLLGSATKLPLFRWLPARRGKSAAWDQLDLTDPSKPRLIVRREDLGTLSS